MIDQFTVGFEEDDGGRHDIEMAYGIIKRRPGGVYDGI